MQLEDKVVTEPGQWVISQDDIMNNQLFFGPSIYLTLTVRNGVFFHH
jgi:hypothetical protein